MFVDFQDPPSEQIDALKFCTNVSQGSRFQSALKRCFDVAFSLIVLTLLSPLFIIVACAIKLESAGPVFFKQTRNGVNGSKFVIYKFRSMGFSKNQKFEQAVQGDSRITRIGLFLRKSSIDEIPQLINVLLGDMSLIGPRPHPLELDAQYEAVLPCYMDRYKVKPGITGLAQVSGHRGPTSTVELMQNRLQSDLQYISNQSFLYDLRILLQTIPAVLFPRNAF